MKGTIHCKSRVAVLVSTLVLAFLFQGAQTAAQSKPTEQEILDAVRRSDSVSDPMGTMALASGDTLAPSKRSITAVKVLRFGTYNNQRNYWPVEVCVSGTAQRDNFGFGPAAAIRVFHAKVQYRFYGDDFGGWKVEEIRPSGGTLVRDLLCGDSSAPSTPARSTAVSPTKGPAEGGRPESASAAPAGHDIELALKKAAGTYPQALAKYDVRHAHAGASVLSQGQWPSCLGVLFVLPDRLEYLPVSDTDGQRHPLTAQNNQIKLVAKNRLSIGELAAFHVTLVDGQNFNFGTTDDPQVIVSTITKRKALK